MWLCVDDTEAVTEDLVGLYTEPRTERSNTTDAVDEELPSPSKKRRRQCLAECDVNSNELNDVRLHTETDDVTTLDSGVSTCQSGVALEAAPACTTAPPTSISPQKQLNKENDGAVTSHSTAVTSNGVTVASSPSQTFKSPPQRRNVFAQNKDGSTARRQRFNLNATKDKLASPESTVEVRSR